MNDQLSTAWTSGLFALLVALLGIAGAIVAQFVATRRAFENSLALFERQAIEDRFAREEAARIEDRHRFADQKRMTYSRALRLADQIATAYQEACDGEERLGHLMEQRQQSRAHAKYLQEWEDELFWESEKYKDQACNLDDELDLVVGEIDLMADDAVCEAVRQLQIRAWVSNSEKKKQYGEARTAFLHAARNELGVLTS